MPTLTPPCKINLGLNVVTRRPDGYHDLQTVFFPIPITDTLSIEPAAGDTRLSVTGINVEGDPENNIVMKAYRRLAADYPLPNLHISLHKAIPTQAGMGGGSADGAYMLRLLNQTFALGLSQSQLINYAAKLGADCPFFILDGPAYAEGIGERLEPISLSLKGCRLVIIRPDIPVSTREAFSLIRPHYPKECCRDIVRLPVESWPGRLTNDFEDSVFALHPEIGKIKEKLYNAGAAYASMSGSGSAIFGLFRQAPKLKSDSYPFVKVIDL